MKREEEIANASTVYSEYEYNQIDFKNGFFTGAKWADENPKSSWISVKDDLPCNHDELLINNKKETKTVLVIVNGRIIMGIMYKKRKWHWFIGTGVEPTHWMPLPELPKE